MPRKKPDLPESLSVEPATAGKAVAPSWTENTKEAVCRSDAEFQAVSKAVLSEVAVALVQAQRDPKKAAELLTDLKHGKNRAAREKALALWRTLKAQGVSKNKAADIIATQVHRSVRTVRDWLAEPRK
jgi:hypothetical protein